MSLTAAGRARSRCFAEPHLAHAAGAQRRHQPVAADRQPFVEQLVVDLEHRAPHTRTARSRTVRSSRMFPGHVYASSRRIDSGDDAVDRPCRAAGRAGARSGRRDAGMSSRRSASAGTAIGAWRASEAADRSVRSGLRRQVAVVEAMTRTSGATVAAPRARAAQHAPSPRSSLELGRQLVDGVEKQRAARSELQLARQQEPHRVERSRAASRRLPTLRVQLGAAHEDERARALGGAVHGVSHRLLSRAGRPDQQQAARSRAASLGDRIPQRADRRAVAEQRALDAAARVAQQLLGDAQLALERRRPLGDARFERRVRRLQRRRRRAGAPRRAARCGSRSRSGWRRSTRVRDRAR